jgi:hypothetical protein
VAPLDIDRDAAHDAAQQELSKAIYPRPSLTEQLLAWLERLLYRVTAGAASLPGGWFTVAILIVLAGVAVFVAIRIARRAMRSTDTHADDLFGEHILSAAEHRASAERHAASAQWTQAIRHRLRAVARQLEENGTLEPAPGRTATELARAAGRAVPALAEQFAAAAEVFNDVTYGELPGDEAGYRVVTALDDALGRHRGTADPAAEPAPAGQQWAQVR